MTKVLLLNRCSFHGSLLDAMPAVCPRSLNAVSLWLNILQGSVEALQVESGKQNLSLPTLPVALTATKW